MFDSISILLLITELALLLWYLFCRKNHKKRQDRWIYLILVFLMTLSLQLVPLLYSIVVLQYDGNLILQLIKCVVDAVKLFIGDVEIDNALEMAKAVPIFAVTYLFGVVLALHFTISTAFAAFRHTIGNYLRLMKAMNRPSCDIVIGRGDKSLQYAKKHKAVLLLTPEAGEKEVAVALMKEGYTVLRRELNTHLLKSNLFDKDKEYNFIALSDGGKGMDTVAYFLPIIRQICESIHKSFHFYLEMESRQLEVVCKEKITETGAQGYITCFRMDEIMARSFATEYPITRYMPKDFVAEDASIRPDKKLNIVFLGFGNRSREVFRQCVLNNQLVCYKDDSYYSMPITYHLYDEKEIDTNEDMFFIQHELESLDKKAYYPLPEAPFALGNIGIHPTYRSTLYEVINIIRQQDSYTQVIIDTGDDYINIETGERLLSLLDREDSAHIYVHSEEALVSRDDKMLYYGDTTSLYEHSVIVNDSIAILAKAIFRYYFDGNSKEDALTSPEQIDAMVEEAWYRQGYYRMYSNHYAAMNLRVKLNLLGLDYDTNEDEKGNNHNLLLECYPRSNTYCYEDYLTRSVRSSLLAQEHARWNAYHLMSEYMPMTKDKQLDPAREEGTPRFISKDDKKKQHICLTTYQGLHLMHEERADIASRILGRKVKPAEYDVYQYDENVLLAAEKVLDQIGYQIFRRPEI